MDIDTYFSHMKRAIYGNADHYDDPDYSDKVQWRHDHRIRRRFGDIKERDGKGYQCPKCKVGFTGTTEGKQVCPMCEYEFDIESVTGQRD
jgi:rubrerythrin